MILMVTIVAGLATRRLVRIVAVDSILDGWRARFFARYPVAGRSPDYRFFRWITAAEIEAIPEAERPGALRGRLHGRRGYWVYRPIPAADVDSEGGFRPPILTWDRTHEGTLARPSYPPRPTSFFGTLVSCPWCLSFWFVVPIMVGWKLLDDPAGVSWPMLGMMTAAAWWIAGIAAHVEDRLAA